jgi:hypothetical protein
VVPQAVAPTSAQLSELRGAASPQPQAQVDPLVTREMVPPVDAPPRPNEGQLAPARKAGGADPVPAAEQLRGGQNAAGNHGDDNRQVRVPPKRLLDETGGREREGPRPE